MKNLTLLSFLFIISTITVFGQRIEIGNNAQEIKALVEYSTRERTGYDSYGNSRGNNVISDVKYRNGQITEVIQCFENEYLYDVGKRANFCKYFVMKNNKLAYIITQYENLSVNQLKNSYNRLNDFIKVGEIYFSKDYKHNSKIYLHSNGLASVEWNKTIIEELSSNIKNEISEKLKVQREKEYQREVSENKRKQKEKEIKSKLYDLKEYFPDEYEYFVSDQRDKILDYFRKTASRGNNSSLFHSNYEIQNSKEKYFRFKSNYELTYFQNERGYTKKEVKLIEGIDTELVLFRVASKALPNLKKEGYEIKTKSFFKNLKVDYTRGFTKIRIKNGVIEFKSNPPLKELQELLIENLKDKPKGKHYLIYEIADVMGIKTVKVEFIKKEKTTNFDILGLKF